MQRLFVNTFGRNVRVLALVAAAALVVVTLGILWLPRPPMPCPDSPPAATAAASAAAPVDYAVVEVVYPDGTTRKVASDVWGAWWTHSFPTWHADVFELFDHYLGSGEYTTYVGFGEWIGPTVLFAAPRVQRAFALEPDPAARRDLRRNVAANPAVAARTHVSSFCIGAEAGTLLMRGRGDSQSFLEGIVETSKTRDVGTLYASTEVTCMKLAAFVEEHMIDVSTTFFKIDTEGAEYAIVPSLHDWLAGMEPGKRPTITLSMHANEAGDAALPAMLKVIHLFRYAGQWEGEKQFSRLPLKKPASEVTLDFLKRCRGCDILMSDRAPPARPRP